MSWRRLQRLALFLICPESREPLDFVVLGEVAFLVCESCGLVFPVLEGIPIILPSAARSRQLELPLIDVIRMTAEAEGARRMADYATHSRELVTRSPLQSWEWEDEPFWTTEYKGWLASGRHKNWNDRLWQREILLRELRRRRFDFRGKVIVDVGAGEGQTFRALIAPLCDTETVYIAIDISIKALQLNRLRNPHENSMFVLAPASPLFLAESSADVACYFGVLHHTASKAESLCQDASIVKPGGYILLHEALERSRLLSNLLPVPEESAHEERIPLQQLTSVLLRCSEHMSIVRDFRFDTVMYGAVMRFLPRVATLWRAVYGAILALDVLAVHTLGLVVPAFRPGEILMVLRKLGHEVTPRDGRPASRARDLGTAKNE